MTLGAILALVLIFFAGWSVLVGNSEKWGKKKDENKKIVRPGVFLWTMILIAALAMQVICPIWFWGQVSEITRINLTGLGTWEESLWNAAGKSTITSKMSGTGDSAALSTWPPPPPRGWTFVQDLSAGPLPSMADGNYQIVAEAAAMLVVGSDITSIVGKLAFTLSSRTAVDASGGTIWAATDTPVLATTGRAMLIKS